MKIKLLILLLALTINGYSQYDFKKGFIVKNNDTIPGLIDYTNPHGSSNYCFYKADSNDAVVLYTPNEISAYGIIGFKLFVSKIVTIDNSTKAIFLEYLVDGIADLYYCGTHNVSQYFIEKNNVLYPLTNEIVEFMVNDKTLLKESEKYKGVLNWLMSDAEEIKSEVYSTKLSHNSLIELTKDYHNRVCENENCIVYYKKQNKSFDAKWQFDFGISVDYVMSIMDLNVSFKNTSENFIITKTNAQSKSYLGGISPGIFLNINRNNRTSFQIQLKYQFMKNSTLEFQNIQIPVMITYDFLRYKKIIPYMIFGISNDFTLKFKTSKQLYAEYDYVTGFILEDSYYVPVYSQSVVYYENRNIINKTYSLYPFEGIGLSCNLPNQHEIKFEFIGYYNLFETKTINTIITSTLDLYGVAFSLKYEF